MISLDKSAITEKLMNRRYIEGDHWLFIGAKDKNSHGQLWISEKLYYVGRLSL